MLRHLATADITLAPAEAAGAPAESMLSALGGQGSVDMVVTGTVLRPLVLQLESTRPSGTLFTIRPTAENAGTAGWPQVMIPSPASAGSPPSDVVHGRAGSSAQRGMKVGEHG